MNPQLEAAWVQLQAERSELETQLMGAQDWLTRRIVSGKLENVTHRLDWSQHLAIRPRA